jgi:multiple sugar transport system permease protein
MTRTQKRELKLGLFFVSPYLMGFIGFTVLPLLASFGFSFTDYDIFNAPKWIGVDNFIKLGRDRLFWTSLWNTAFYTVFAVPLGMIAAFLLALISRGAERRRLECLVGPMSQPSGLLPRAASNRVRR